MNPTARVSCRSFFALLLSFGLLLMFGIHGPAIAANDWLQGPNGNLAVTTAVGTQQYAAAIPDGAGGAFVVWHDQRDSAATGWDIYAQHVLGTGVVDPAWPSMGVPIAAVANQQMFPSLCSDGAGGAYVAWLRTNIVGVTGGVFVQHLSSTGALNPAWSPLGLELTTVPAQNCKIASDGSGGAYVVWSTLVEERVYVAHVLASGIDPVWGGGVRVCTNEASQTVPAICTDGANGVFVAWNDRRAAGATRDIYVNRMLIDGTRAMPALGTPVCVATGNQRLNGSSVSGTAILTLNEAQSTAMAPDGTGGFLVTWTDERTVGTTGIDIYVQRMTSSGAVSPGWPVDGAAACGATGDQTLPNLLTDGSGGGTVLWRDTRPGIYVRRATPTGLDGNVDGLQVDAQGTDKPVGVRDGSNGAIIAYMRLESGFNNLYAQHVLNTPNCHVDPTWPAGGLALSTASGDQWLWTMVSDNASGAIALFVDTRDSVTNKTDVYAQRALATGALPAGSTAVPLEWEASDLLRVAPNPIGVMANVRYSVPTRSHVRIELYDVIGRRVLSLADGHREAGEHVARSATGSLRNGVYYLRMTAQPLGGGVSTAASRRVVVAR